ncbi:GtrA family protein [Marinobacter salinexigens]|uniref:GtrA family protein n=1 Tax=Marinobacter salinexigens TaxID=2919747 RepID=A0A5B0VK91_9GAMM|nr:GtrA family protein [Marinobacter salinexigens]KAA1174381.1 GtrA family protein [Marinobacter salinexigens]
MKHLKTLISGKQRLSRFLIAGGLATFVHWLSMYVLIRFGMTAEPATAFGAALGLLANYSLQYRYAFRSALPHRVAFSRYLSTSALGWGLNLALFSFIRFAGADTLVSQVVTTGLVAFANYLLADRYVFHEEPNTNIESPHA